MKILESTPQRYDRGIRWLSFGHSERIKHEIVQDTVKPGDRVLDIGTGTATLAVSAARTGASVVGCDISNRMLEVARRNVQDSGCSDKVQLNEMGISGIDGYPAESFDVIFLSLVLSELSPDEQRYTLKQAYRVLRTGGLVAIADEVTPAPGVKRLLKGMVRMPLVPLTFLITQTTTKPVSGLPLLVEQSQFIIMKQELSFLDSFLYLVAGKQT